MALVERAGQDCFCGRCSPDPLVEAQRIVIFASGDGPWYSWLRWYPVDHPEVEAIRGGPEVDYYIHFKLREWEVDLPGGMSENEVFAWCMKRMWVPVDR